MPECGGQSCQTLDDTEVDTVQDENNSTIVRETQRNPCNLLCKFK
jgi:hypothetical protein